MFALRKLAPVAPKIAQQQTRNIIVSGPPMVRISFPEKVVHGVIMTLSCVAIPFYILANIRRYRDKA